MIFDLDGTLVEFPHEFMFSESLRIIERLAHPTVERCLLEECFSEFDFFRFVRDDAPETFIERFWAEFNWDAYPRCPVLPGAEELCSQLYSLGTKLAVATARIGSESELLESLDHTNLGERFAVLAGRPDNDHHWKDKRPQIRKVCAELGVHPAEAVMVGDIPPDITSAREAGVGLTVAVLSGGIREDILAAAQPDLLIDSVLDLFPLLQSLLRKAG